MRTEYSLVEMSKTYLYIFLINWYSNLPKCIIRLRKSVATMEKVEITFLLLFLHRTKS